MFFTPSGHLKMTTSMISDFEEGKLEGAEAARAALLREVSRVWVSTKLLRAVVVPGFACEVGIWRPAWPRLPTCLVYRGGLEDTKMPRSCQCACGSLQRDRAEAGPLGPPMFSLGSRQGGLAEVHSHAALPGSSPVQKLGLTFLSALTPSLSRKPDTQDSRRVTGREAVGQKDLKRAV